MTQKQKALVERLDSLRQWLEDVNSHDTRTDAQTIREAIAALSAPAGVGVKKLEWSDYGSHAIADSIVGRYIIRTDGIEYRVIVGDERTEKPFMFGTLAECKVAAQADFERRILSSLSTMPGEAVVDDVAPLSCRLEGPVNIVDAVTIDRVDRHARRLSEQVNRLAEVIMHEIAGEPSNPEEGAVDCAIRLLRQGHTAPAQHDGWRPIETAETSVAECLLWAPHVGVAIGRVDVFSDGDRRAAAGGYHGFRWEKWMPLPPLPASPVKGGEGNG